MQLKRVLALLLLLTGAAFGQSGTVIVPFSATPTFDATQGATFLMTLTGNVTSSGVRAATAGAEYKFILCQDGTGNRTFAWPSAFSSPPTISATASACTTLVVIFDGANFVAPNPTIGTGVTSTGTPASGNLTKFSGATAITNGDLSGDATTSGTLAVTVSKTGGVAFAPSATTDTTNATNIASGTLNAARLPTSVPTSVVNDTNVTGSIAANALTLGWTGTLAKGRTLGATVYTDQANTFGAFLQKFQSGANFNFADPTDTTKLAQFDLSNIATGTTRTVNIPNGNSTTVQSDTGAANNFLTAISPQGLISKVQPSCSSLSNSGTGCSGTAVTANSTTNALPYLSSANTYSDTMFRFVDANTVGTGASNAVPKVLNLTGSSGGAATQTLQFKSDDAGGNSQINAGSTVGGINGHLSFQANDYTFNAQGNGAFSVAGSANFNVNTSGIPTKSNNTALGGLGVGAILPIIVSSSVNANITAATIVTAPATNGQCPASLTANCSIYILDWYIDLSAVGTSCTGSTTVVFNILYTDPLGASQQTVASGTITIATNSNGTLGTLVANGRQMVIAKLSTTVQYSTTSFTAGTGCSPAPKYQITIIPTWKS